MKQKSVEFKVLNRKSEMELSKEEKNAYYRDLREYCCKRKLQVTTKGALSIAPRLKGITGEIARKFTRLLSRGPVTKVVEGIENIPEGAVLFAGTHQGILDGFVWITDCPKHALIVHGTDASKFLIVAQLNTGLILVTRDKKETEKRTQAKLDMISALLRGHAVFIFPEATWNLTPNRLHLPLNYGFVDVAQKSGVPIIPVVFNYTYDTSTERERITSIHIRYGKPIHVGESDDIIKKLDEYSEAIATMRWEMIEQRGVTSRKCVTNSEYINYLKGNLANLEMGNINVEIERNVIYGAQDEFYVFHHINDIPFDEKGNLLNTKEHIRLEELNRLHGI